MLAARRSPKRATAVAVFDKLVAFPSLLSHPNLTIEGLQHAAGAAHASGAPAAVYGERLRYLADARTRRG